MPDIVPVPGRPLAAVESGTTPEAGNIIPGSFASALVPESVTAGGGSFTPAYGVLNISGNATATSMPTQNTDVPIVAGWAGVAAAAQGVTENAAAGTLTVAAAGIYLVAVTLNLSQPNNAGDRFQARVYNNATPQHLLGLQKMVNATDFDCVSFSGLVGCAAGDVLSVQIQDQTNGGATIVVIDASFNVVRVG